MEARVRRRPVPRRADPWPRGGRRAAGRAREADLRDEAWIGGAQRRAAEDQAEGRRPRLPAPRRGSAPRRTDSISGGTTDSSSRSPGVTPSQSASGQAATGPTSHHRSRWTTRPQEASMGDRLPADRLRAGCTYAVRRRKTRLSPRCPPSGARRGGDRGHPARSARRGGRPSAMRPIVNDDECGRRCARWPRRCAIDEHGAAAHEVGQRLLHHELALGVEIGGRIVEDEDGGVLQERAGDGQPLALPARQPHPALAHQRVVALGTGEDELLGVRVARGARHVGERRVGPPVGDVVVDRVAEQERVLRDERDLRAQRVLREIRAGRARPA